MDIMDMWASLTTDLLLVIFVSLEPTAVIRCAGVCKTWRRAIIANASIIGAIDLDRFGRRSLLLGVFHHSRDSACLRRTPGPFQSALPWIDGGDNETAAAHSLIPRASAASSGGAVDRCLYKELLCSSDGFILLMAWSGSKRSLCLCNPMTGDCMFLRPADTASGKYSTYFLLTSYDDGLCPCDNRNKLVARILAVHTTARYNDLEFVFKLEGAQVLSYQIFSTSGDDTGKWGSARHSVGESEEGLCVRMDCCSTVVCGHAVYWLAGREGYITCVLALDVGTGKTWTTELPTQCRCRMIDLDLAILASSSDGRLSLIQTFQVNPEIKVWVLTGNDGWTVQQTILVGSQSLISGDSIPRSMSFCAFCPRSWCMVAMSSDSDHEFLIDLGTSSSHAPVMRIGNCDGSDCCPYEIDCLATYISRMKHF